MGVFGTVGIRSFDQGMVDTLEAELVSGEVDGATRQWYAVDMPDVDSKLDYLGGKVPILVAFPEDVYQLYTLPSVTIVRNDLNPNFDRAPVWGKSGRAPAEGAEAITLPTGESGYSHYESQLNALPFDITYDVHIRGRRQAEALPMLHYVLKRFRPPFFSLRVVDSKGEIRLYDAGEISIGNGSELADIADRTIAFTISLTVRAELDLDDTTVATAVTGFGGSISGSNSSASPEDRYGHGFLNDGDVNQGDRSRVTGFARCFGGGIDILYTHYCPQQLQDELRRRGLIPEG